MQGHIKRAEGQSAAGVQDAPRKMGSQPSEPSPRPSGGTALSGNTASFTHREAFPRDCDRRSHMLPGSSFHSNKTSPSIHDLWPGDTGVPAGSGP